MVLLLAGCNGKGDTAATDDTATSTDTTPDTTTDAECEDDDDCASWEICEDDACTPGDRNDSPEDSEDVLWETGTGGYLQTGDDVDYYTFGAEGGEWIRVTTEPLQESSMNTVLSLYDPNGKLHHTEDDFPTGPVSTYDTVMYAYLPDGGDWTLAVEDRDGAGGNDFEYELVVQETSAHTSETDSFSDPAASVTAESSATIWTVGVLLEEAGDVDYIDLSLPYEDCPVLIYGAQYADGTDAVATVELYTPEQDRLLRKEGLGPDGVAQHYGVDGGRAIIAASDAAGGGGDNHWFFIYVVIGESGTWDREDEPNDEALDATLIPDLVAYESSSGDYMTASMWGEVEDSSDEDWYALYVPEEADGRWLHVFGSASRYGSLISTGIEITDDLGSPLTGDTFFDDGDNFPDLANVGPVTGGEIYYIRIDDVYSSGGLDHTYRISPYLADFSYNP